VHRGTSDFYLAAVTLTILTWGGQKYECAKLQVSMSKHIKCKNFFNAIASVKVYDTETRKGKSLKVKKAEVQTYEMQNY